MQKNQLIGWSVDWFYSFITKVTYLDASTSFTKYNSLASLLFPTSGVFSPFVVMVKWQGNRWWLTCYYTNGWRLLFTMKVKIQKIQAPNTRGYFKIDGRWHAERRKNACLAWNFSDSSLLPSSLLWKYGFFNRLWNFGRKLRLWYKNFKNRDQATNKKGNLKNKVTNKLLLFVKLFSMVMILHQDVRHTTRHSITRFWCQLWLKKSLSQQ